MEFGAIGVVMWLMSRELTRCSFVGEREGISKSG